MTPAEYLEEFGCTPHPEVRAFFTEGYRPLQGAPLEGMAYLSPLFVDFEGSLSSAWAQTLESMTEQGLDGDGRECVDHDGAELVPIAWLFADADADEPEGAYLACDVTRSDAPVYLVDPSGDPERVVDALLGLAARLQRQPAR